MQVGSENWTMGFVGLQAAILAAYAGQDLPEHMSMVAGLGRVVGLHPDAEPSAYSGVPGFAFEELRYARTPESQRHEPFPRTAEILQSPSFGAYEVCKEYAKLYLAAYEAVLFEHQLDAEIDGDTGMNSLELALRHIEVTHTLAEGMRESLLERGGVSRDDASWIKTLRDCGIDHRYFALGKLQDYLPEDMHLTLNL